MNTIVYGKALPVMVAFFRVGILQVGMYERGNMYKIFQIDDLVAVSNLLGIT